MGTCRDMIYGCYTSQTSGIQLTFMIMDKHEQLWRMLDADQHGGRTNCDGI